MSQGVGILVAFLLFSFIVFFHELGHFLLAKRGGIGVEEFSIGMGPKLWSTQKGDTVYSIRLLPIGGFCAMLGEDDAGGGLSSKDKKKENGKEDEIDEIVEIDVQSDPHAFNNRPLKDRILAVLAGPFFNFILALVFAFVLIIATGSVFTNVLTVNPEFPAYKAGIRDGDQLISINGHRILQPLEASTYILVEQGKPVNVEVKRNNEKMNFMVTPKVVEQNGQKGYFIGIGYESMKPSFFQTFYYAFIKFWSMIKMTFFTLFALISGQVSLKMLSGPVGIVNALSKSYGGGITLAQFIAIFSSQIVLISANLGIMNLLPIPALDGGRLVFLFIEGIRGKPIDPKKEGYIHFAGFVLLMLLMVVVFYSDIMKLVTGKM